MDIKEIRLFLLSLGFQPSDSTGMLYVLTKGDITFTANLNVNTLFARFPDKVYNKANPYAHKDAVVDFDFSNMKNIEDLERFVNKSFL